MSDLTNYEDQVLVYDGDATKTSKANRDRLNQITLHQNAGQVFADATDTETASLDDKIAVAGGLSKSVIGSGVSKQIELSVATGGLPSYSLSRNNTTSWHFNPGGPWYVGSVGIAKLSADEQSIVSEWHPAAPSFLTVPEDIASVAVSPQASSTRHKPSYLFASLRSLSHKADVLANISRIEPYLDGGVWKAKFYGTGFSSTTGSYAMQVASYNFGVQFFYSTGITTSSWTDMMFSCIESGSYQSAIRAWSTFGETSIKVKLRKSGGNLYADFQQVHIGSANFSDVVWTGYCATP